MVAKDKPRCPEIHPVYRFQCAREAGHPGPCVKAEYWNEERD